MPTGPRTKVWSDQTNIEKLAPHRMWTNVHQKISYQLALSDPRTMQCVDSRIWPVSKKYQWYCISALFDANIVFIYANHWHLGYCFYFNAHFSDHLFLINLMVGWIWNHQKNDQDFKNLCFDQFSVKSKWFW